jgi:hypothetical protein
MQASLKIAGSKTEHHALCIRSERQAHNSVMYPFI